MSDTVTVGGVRPNRTKASAPPGKRRQVRQSVIPVGKDPWERLPEETDYAWRLFQAFRDLGPTRTVKAVCEKEGLPYPRVTQLRWRHHWAIRIRAWEDEQDRQWREETLRTRRQVARKHARIAGQLQIEAARNLQDMSTRPAMMTPSEVARFLELAVRIEQQLFGLGESDEAAGITTATGRRIILDPDVLPPETVLAVKQLETAHPDIIEAAP